VLANPMSPRNAVFYGVLSGANASSGPEDRVLLADNDRRFLSGGVQLVLRAPFSTGPVTHAVEVQARYHYDLADRHHTGHRYDMRDGQLALADAPVEELLYNLEDTKALALAAIDAMRLGPVTLTPGVRFELIRSRSNDKLAGTFSEGGTNALLPGIGAHWQIIPELGVLAGVYRGFTPPAPGQGNPPEYSVNYEAGARWTRRQERVEVVGFFNDYSNLTSICTLSSGCSSSNLDRQFSAGRARIFGLEAYAEKTFRLPHGIVVPLSAAYTFTQTALLASFSSPDPQLGDVEAGDELPYVPHHQLNLAAGIDVWRVSAHAQLNFIDRMREVAGQGAALPGTLTDPQAVLDVHLGFRLFDWAQLYLDVRNLGDNRVIVARRPFGARPNAPRTIIAGLKLDY
jgi:Fe(3+) dicitrate transport protein